eukprot:Hpha_TRINITY_DN16776_c3_g2::TRINITY_DN16776_c3_g2_i2::g.76464::m.76464/K05181/GABRB; gamma-aminobutyric acid receptor subunit beta
MPRAVLLSLAAFAAAERACNRSAAGFLDCFLPEEKTMKWDPPPGKTKLEISANIVKIAKLDTNWQSFVATLYFRQLWTDPRLAWDPAVQGFDFFHLLAIDRIWKPDTFFNRGIAKLENDHEQALWMYPEGKLFWSQRVVLNVMCPMSFRFFPLDVQHCETSVESYGTSVDKITIEPSKSPWEPLVLDPQMTNVDIVGSYKITDLNVSTKIVNYGGKDFPSLLWKFTFSRGRTTYIITTFLPLWLVVGLASLGPFMNPEAVPARVSLGITTVLVLISLMFLLTRALPEQPEPSALDLYILMCFVYVTMYLGLKNL